MKPTIRPFQPADYDKMVALWSEVGLPARLKGRDSRDNVEEQTKSGTTLLLIAEAEGQIVGTAWGTHDGRKGWINRLAVKPGFRRHKIATQLVRELEKHFETLGIEVTACLIEADNHVSMQVFKQLGYQEWSGKYFSKRKSEDS